MLIVATEAVMQDLPLIKIVIIFQLRQLPMLLNTISLEISLISLLFTVLLFILLIPLTQFSYNKLLLHHLYLLVEGLQVLVL